MSDRSPNPPAASAAAGTAPAAAEVEARDRSLWRQSRRVLQRDAGACPSPCMGVCQMSSHSGLCQGCWRSLDEIGHWGSAPQPYKRSVWQRIQQRLQDAYPQGLSV